MTKLCSKCEKTKEAKEFTKDKRYADGLFCWCRECKKHYARSNPHQVNNWVDKHPQQVKVIKDKYVFNNPETVKASKQAWSKANPKKELAKTRKYQASKLNATPNWLSQEQSLKMVEIYLTCPFGYEVDHIVPLKGKIVSGLHVPWNLQHLPIKSNRQKSNKY
jgi:hypothetical protein